MDTSSREKSDDKHGVLGKVYSVPRRYDLSLMLAVFVAYALMFGLMRALDTLTPVFIGVTVFVTIVGVGQALLFGGENPRGASSVIGGVLYFVIMLGVGIAAIGLDSLLVGFKIILISPFAGIVGLVWGYIVGTLIGGVFLVADMIRKGIARWRPPVVADDRDPFGP